MDADLLDNIADTARRLSEHDSYISWCLKEQWGYPRDGRPGDPVRHHFGVVVNERLGATSTYLTLLDHQLDNIERLRK